MTFANIMREKGFEPSCPERAPDPKSRARPPTHALAGAAQNEASRSESAGIGSNPTADVTSDVTSLPAEKRCPRCEETKPRAEFNIKRQDGKVYLQYYCRPCHAAKERERYAASPAYREQIRRRDIREYAERTQAARARRASWAAIRRGRIPRGPCEQEGPECRGQIQGHHDDYSKPLEIRWLCRKHHVDADRARRERERAA